MKAGQHSHKKRVRVSGVTCESMGEAAKEAGKVLGREVKLWEIQRILAGKKHIAGLSVKAL